MGLDSEKDAKMIEINGKRFEIGSDKSLAIFEIDGSGKESLITTLQDWEVFGASRSMRYWVQRIGSFSVNNLLSAPPFRESDRVKAQGIIDYCQSLGLINAIGRGRYRAACWIDDEVLFEEAA